MKTKIADKVIAGGGGKVAEGSYYVKLGDAPQIFLGGGGGGGGGIFLIRSGFIGTINPEAQLACIRLSSASDLKQPNTR